MEMHRAARSAGITWRAWTALGSAVALPVTLTAQGVAAASVTQGTLAFDAHASLGAFTGTTTTVSGHITASDSIADVRGWVEAPSASLTTNNGHRDRDMASSLEIAKYTTLRFDLSGVTVGAASGDSTAVTLHGRFTLHGTTHDTDVPGWLWRRDTGVRFRGAVPINCKDYGVGGLSKMLGVLKMDPKITVRIEVTFGG